jgi:hypothetical protein
MSKTITEQIYRYSELPTTKAKEKARYWWIQDSDYTDDLNDMFKYKLTEAGYVVGYMIGRGLKNVETYRNQDGKKVSTKVYEWMDEYMRNEIETHYSLSNCQGDGMGFYGLVSDPVHLAALCRRLFTKGVPDHASRRQSCIYYISRGLVTLNIAYRGWGHYNHWNTMEPDLEYVDDDKVTKYGLDSLEIFLKLVDDDIMSMSRQLERAGYDYIEDRESEEVVAEDLEANDYYFYASGKITPRGIFDDYEEGDENDH